MSNASNVTLEVLEANKVKSVSKVKSNDKGKALNFLNAIKDFETDRIDLIKKSEKKAWRVTGVLSVISIAALITCLFAPFKTVVPYVMVVNESTGQTELITPIADKQLKTYGEKMDKYWLSQFVIFRDSYQWEDIQLGFNSIKLMSSDDVFAKYATEIKSPNSAVEVFQDKKNIEVKIKGVTFQPTKWDGGTLAVVYFSKEVVNKDGTPAIGFNETEWRATIVFDYTKEIKTQQGEFINPMRFKVTSYREDRINK